MAVLLPQLWQSKRGVLPYIQIGYVIFFFYVIFIFILFSHMYDAIAIGMKYDLPRVEDPRLISKW